MTMCIQFLAATVGRQGLLPSRGVVMAPAAPPLPAIPPSSGAVCGGSDETGGGRTGELVHPTGNNPPSTSAFTRLVRDANTLASPTRVRTIRKSLTAFQLLLGGESPLADVELYRGRQNVSTA